MNWLYLVFGIPVGMVSFLLGEFLAKRYTGKSDAIRGLLLSVPFAIVCLIVIILGWQ